MKNLKHTPGPMEVIPKHSRPLDQYWTPVAQTSSGTRIAEFKFENDAKLFAVAPELLNSLIEVLSCIDQHTDDPVLAPIIETAQLTIKKAKGA